MKDERGWGVTGTYRVTNPADRRDVVGEIRITSAIEVTAAIARAAAAQASLE